MADPHDLPTNLKVRCGKCKLIFQSEDEYHRHLVRSDRHIVCEHCYAEFYDDRTLREHLLQLHPVEQDIKCQCGRRFTRAAALIAHISENCPAIESDLEVRRAQMWIKSTVPVPPADPNQPDDHPPPSSASVDSSSHSDDLLIFDSPHVDGLTPDNPWSAEQNYPTESHEAGSKGKGKEKQVLLDILKSKAPASGEVPKKTYAQMVVPSFPVLKPEIKPQVESVAESVVEPESKPTQDPNTSAPAEPSDEDGDLTKEQAMEQIAKARIMKEEADRNNPHHPSCPDFDVSNYWNGVIRAYRCPYPGCRTTKPNKHTFIQHLVSQAHSEDKITCVVCCRTYNSPVAYMQHFESQGKRCKIRDTATSNAILQMATGGVVKIIGKNPDRTNRYGAYVDDETPGSSQAAQRPVNNTTAKTPAGQPQKEPFW